MGGRHRTPSIWTARRFLVLTTGLSLGSGIVVALTISPPEPLPQTPQPQPPPPVAVALPTPTTTLLSTPTPIPPTSTQPKPKPKPKVILPPPPAPSPPPKPEPEPEPEPKPVNECSTTLAGTQPHVAQAGNFLRLKFNIPLSVIGGRAYRANTSDHPLGLALDFTVNRATGDELAEYALDNSKLLSVKYVIWRQRIAYPGGSWTTMEDRGGVTANHYDHVHISFLSSPTGNPTC